MVFYLSFCTQSTWCLGSLAALDPDTFPVKEGRSDLGEGLLAVFELAACRGAELPDLMAAGACHG